MRIAFFSLCSPMSRSVRHLTVWAMLASAPPAFAQVASDPDATAAEPGAAKARFTNAQKLFKLGQFSEALPIFTELVETTHSPNARLYVAHCLQQLRNRVDAYKAFAA